jgi:cytochrome oxidase Cu insertion factor (SCO1/SenC/PrrC family)
MGLRSKTALLVAGIFLATGAALSIGLSAIDAGSVGPPSASIGDQMDRAVPASLLDASFTDQEGRSVTLRQFAGKAIFLVPFLTSCQEECPVTTGALLALERELAAQHLTPKAAIVEVTVDPGRDTPQRMAAYAKLTGVTWPLLTASPATLTKLWHFFGIYYQVVPEGSPAGIDWETGKPYCYDVNHSDGFVLLNPALRERFVAAGMVSGATVPKALRRLLDAQGVYDLKHPGGGSWTVDQAFNAIDWVLD